MPHGRQDESIGAVPIAALKGEALANAMMKCETKAKRRVTLSICGLGMLDETEVESVSSSQTYHVTAPVPDPSQAEKLHVSPEARPPAVDANHGETPAPAPDLTLGAVLLQKVTMNVRGAKDQVGTAVRAYRRCRVIRRDDWACRDHHREERRAMLAQLQADHRRRLDEAEERRRIDAAFNVGTMRSHQ